MFVNKESVLFVLFAFSMMNDDDDDEGFDFPMRLMLC